MPSIGPYSFSTMDGRLVTAGQPTIPTVRGMKVGKRRPRPSNLRTSQEFASFADAWAYAFAYRSTVGALTTVTDDGGISCPCALINDVRIRVLASTAGIGATLETLWTIVPAVSYGDYGTALDYVVQSAPGVKTLALVAPPALGGSSTISVGGIPFTAATGDLQPPLSSGQYTAVLAGAKAIGADDVVRAPSMGQGSLECNVGAVSEAASFDLMRRARLLVGEYVAVNLGGVQISPVACADADVTWAATSGGLPAGQTHLVTVTFDLQLQDDDEGDGSNSCAIVQVAKSWGAWQTVRGAVCYQAAEGLNGSAGQTTFEVDLGKTLRATRVETHEPTDYTGMWCRILSRTRTDGTPDPIGSVRTPVWHGVVLSDDVTGGSGAPSATLSVCVAGLVTALDQIFLHRWYEDGQAAKITDPGQVLGINQLMGGDAGGASGGGGEMATIVVHDRARATAAGVADPRKWTALEAVRTLLRALSIQYPGGPTWAVGGLTAALGFSGIFDLTGKSVLQQIAEIISPRRGLTFYVEVSGSTATLRVNTTTLADVTVAGVTLPANDRQSNVDLTGRDVTALHVRRDRSQQTDRLMSEGGPTWICASFGFGTVAPPAVIGRYQMAKGWTAATETAKTAADAVAKDKPEFADVYRKFVIAPDYDGSVWRGRGAASTVNKTLKSKRTVATSAQRGVDGETGDLEYDADNPLPKAGVLRFTRELPLWKGQAIDANALAGSYPLGVEGVNNPNGEVEGPMMFGYTPSTAAYEVLTNRWQMQIADGGAAVILGRNSADADEINAYLASGKIFVFTIGMLSPMPWRVSWRRDPDARPRDQERSLLRQFPSMHYRRILAGTVTGLTSTAVPVITVNDVKYDWDSNPVQATGTSKIDQELQLARLWSEPVAKSLTYERRGVLDTGTQTAPGSMVNAASIPIDGTRQYDEAVNCVYTGRTWSFKVSEAGTAYTGERILAGTESWNMGAPMAPINLGGVAMNNGGGGGY